MERYSRQIMLPEIGVDGQRKLSLAKVLIVGLGGLGSPVALYLAGAGVGKLGLCDADTVSLSNLQRQILYREEEVGQSKTEVAARKLTEMNSDIKFELIPEPLTMENASRLVNNYDIVIDCCDNHATRYLINDVCRNERRPWIYGSIGTYTGCVSTFLPDSNGYEGLFPDREELTSLPPSRGGVVGTVPGIFGAIQAAEAIKLICGFGELLSGRLLIGDINTMTFKTIEI